MAQKPFGRILAEARERQGMDIKYASQVLRIREDILRAIERNDFSRMPARGYTRNMVSAYARLLGLNAPSITRQYLDEADAYEQRSASSREGGTERMNSRRSRGEGRGTSGRDSSRTVRNSRGREVYSDRDERGPRSAGRRVSYQEQPKTIRTNRGGRSMGRGYSGGYAGGGAANPLLAKLPLIAGGIVAIVLVIFIITQIVGCVAPKNSENVTSIPITGVSDTTNSSSDSSSSSNTASTSEPTPTSVSVTYNVASGNSTYVEIYENGETIASEFGIITGPSTANFTVTKQLEIRAVDSSQIKIQVDGQDVAMTFDSELGVYVYKLDFAQYLNEWARSHRNGGAGATSTTSNTGATTATNTTNTNTR